MPGFTETMHLKEMAEENIYFARRDRELIAELRRRQATETKTPPPTGEPKSDD